MCVSNVSLLVDPPDLANQEMKVDTFVSGVGALERDTKSSANVELGSHKKVVKVAVARKNYTRDEYSFLKSDSSPCLDDLNFPARSKKQVAEKPEKPKELVNEKLERPTKQVNGKLEVPEKRVNEKPKKPMKQVEEKLVRPKKQVDEIPEKPKKHVDEIPEKPKKHVDKKYVVDVPEKPGKQVDEKRDRPEKPGNSEKHVDDKPGKPRKVVNEKLERSMKQLSGKPGRPKKHGDVMPKKTENQVDEKAGKFKRDVDDVPGKFVKQVHEKAEKPVKHVDEKAGKSRKDVDDMPGKPVKQVHERIEKLEKHNDEKAGKSRKDVDDMLGKPEIRVDEKSEMKSIKDTDGQSTFRHNHVSTLESDPSIRSQDTSNSAKPKRKMPTDAISGGENHQLLKASKKARLNQGDTFMHEHDNGTRTSNDTRELDVTAKMRTEEYPLADLVKDVNKKKKRRKMDGTYSSKQDLCVSIVSHKDKLQQLLRSQRRQKIGNRSKDLAVESENVPIDNKSKTSITKPEDVLLSKGKLTKEGPHETATKDLTVEYENVRAEKSKLSTIEPEDVLLSKRKLTMEGAHETVSEEVDYKTMDKQLVMEAGGDVLHARKRLKRLKRLNEEKEVVEFEKSGLVPAEEITFTFFGDETRRDNESGVRSHVTSTDCNSTDVDVNNPVSRDANEQEVNGRFLDRKSLEDPVSLPVRCTPKSLNQEQESPVESTAHSKDGHTTLVKIAMVKRYIPLVTKKQKTSDVPVIHEGSALQAQGKVRRYSREELQEAAADSEVTHMSDSLDPYSLSYLNEPKPTAKGGLSTAKEQADISKTKHEVEWKSQRVSNHDSTGFDYPEIGRKAYSRTKKVKFGKSGKTMLEGCGNKSVIFSKSVTKVLEGVPHMKLMKAKSLAKNESEPHGLAKPEAKTRNSGKLASSGIIPIVPTSFGCARCSITGWEWRAWARDRAKRRLQRRVKTVIRKEVKHDLKKLRRATKKKETNVSNNVTTAVIAGLQAARKNRADMRKLAVAADGSDLLRFNMLKVNQAAGYNPLQVYIGLFDFLYIFSLRKAFQS